MQYPHRQSGFTLLEILLASALSSFLFISLFSIFFEINYGDQWRQKVADFVEDIQFLQHTLTDNIKSAGDNRCISLRYPVDMKQAVRGYRAENIPNEWGIHALLQSDILVITRCIFYQHKNQFVQLAFFVADTHRKNNRGQEIYSFYQKFFGGHAEELVANMQMMHIVYGLHQTKNWNVSQYLVADEILDWQAVRSIELNIQDEILKKTLTFYIKLREQP